MIDLKQLMEERSATLPSLGELRLGQVQQAITERRRRRIAVGAVTTVVVLLLLGGYQLMPARHTAPPADPTPTATPSPLNAGFPEYTSGARLLTFASAPMSERKVSITWIPTTLDIMWSGKCAHMADGMSVETELRVNGKLMAAGGCVKTGRFHGEKAWTDAGVQIGKLATISITVLEAEVYRSDDWQQGVTPTPIPASATVAVAIYERIPFEEYPLPPRPAQLRELDPSMGCFGASYSAQDTRKPQVVRSDPGDPLKPKTLRVEWRDNLKFHYRSQTPGLLHVDVNGFRMATGEWWDYEAQDIGSGWTTTSPRYRDDLRGWVEPAQGETVTVTVTPEHVTGAWQFHIFRSQANTWSTACNSPSNKQ